MTPATDREARALHAAIDTATAINEGGGPVLQALVKLRDVCVAMDAENQMERPTEAEYQSALSVANAAIVASKGG